MTTQLEFALWYARSGMAVLPLHWPVRYERSYRCSCGRRDCASPAKHPFGRLVQNGLLDASKDPAAIASWFGQGQLNIGIATGAVKVRTSYAHDQFHSWALAEGFKRETLPAVNGFVQRIKANATGIEYRRTRDGRFLLGMIVHHFAPPGTFP